MYRQSSSRSTVETYRMKSRVGEEGKMTNVLDWARTSSRAGGTRGGTRQGKGLVVCPAPQSNNLKQDSYCLRVDVGLTSEVKSVQIILVIMEVPGNNDL